MLKLLKSIIKLLCDKNNSISDDYFDITPFIDGPKVVKPNIDDLELNKPDLDKPLSKKIEYLNEISKVKHADNVQK